MSHSISKKADIRLGLPILVSLDILCALASISISTFFNWKTLDLIRVKDNDPAFISIIIFVTLLNFYLFDLYYTTKDFRRFSQLINIVESLIISFAIMTGLAFLDKTLIFGRRFLFSYILIMFFLAIVTRSIFSVLQKRYLYKNAAIISYNHMSDSLVKTIGLGEIGKAKYGINLVGYISDKRSDIVEGIKQMPYLGDLNNISGIIKAKHIDLIIYALERPGDAEINELLIKEKLRGLDLISAIGLYEALTGRIPYKHINSAWLIEGCLRGHKFTETRLKRLFDILLSAIFLAISIPLIGLCAAIVKIESKGPAFFIQKRTGRFGKRFKIYKIRSMHDKKIMGKSFRDSIYNEKTCATTRFGKFMRKYHIDELPQIFNVLIGDMSLVGPRPEMEIVVRKCEKSIPLYRLRLAVRPGLTGWAQVWFPHVSTLSAYKVKFEYDLYYLENLSLKLDLEIMMRTILRLVGYPRDIYNETHRNR